MMRENMELTTATAAMSMFQFQVPCGPNEPAEKGPHTISYMYIHVYIYIHIYIYIPSSIFRARTLLVREVQNDGSPRRPLNGADRSQLALQESVF